MGNGAAPTQVVPDPGPIQPLPPGYVSVAQAEEKWLEPELQYQRQMGDLQAKHRAPSDRSAQNAAADADAVMSDAEVADFNQYYERVTLHNFNVLPTLAGATIKLGLDHQAVSLEFAKAPGFG